LPSISEEERVSPPEFPTEEFSPEDEALLNRAAALLAASASAPPDDIELATAIEFLRVSRAPINTDFARLIESRSSTGFKSTVKIGLVPGAFYREHSHTGADGAHVLKILDQLGHQAELIPVQSFGSLSDNADIIVDWVKRQAAIPVLLISLSKGAGDVKVALPRLADSNQSRKIAWISLSGISTGTPLVDWLRRRPWRWWAVWLLLKLRRQRIAVLQELRHGPDALLASWPQLPANLQVVHVHGFPLRKHLSHPWAAKAYRRLAPLGPNDGGSVLLSDIAQWPGIVVPLWGVDHYMQPKHDINPRLKRVFETVLDRLV
jgi:hypothetical protein